jgi:hypothetical protein
MAGDVVKRLVGGNDNESACVYQANPGFCKVKNCEEDMCICISAACAGKKNEYSLPANKKMAPMFIQTSNAIFLTRRNQFIAMPSDINIRFEYIQQ